MSSDKERIKISKLVGLLKDKEPEFIVKGMAKTSYNSSIARVLEKGGAVKFENAAWDEVQKLSEVSSRDGFDAFHDGFVENLWRIIKTNIEGDTLPESEPHLKLL